MVHWEIEHACYCEHCRRAYRDASGQEIPRDTADLAAAIAFREWRNTNLTTFEKKVTSTIRAIKPDIRLIINGAYFTKLPMRPSEYVDCLAWDILGSPLNMSFEARYLQNLGKPYDVMSVRSVDGDQRWTLRPTEAFQFEAATLIANGAGSYVIDEHQPDGGLEAPVYESIGEAYSYLKAREAYARGATPVPYIGILHGAETANAKAPLDPTPEATESVRGVHKALVMGGVPCTILNSWTLAEELQRGYRLLVLPDQWILTDEALAAIREFVRAGGRLLSTGETSLRDSGGRLLADFRLADVFGVKLERRVPFPSVYLRPTPVFRQGTRIHDMPLPLADSRARTPAAAFYVRTTTGEPLCPLVNPIAESVLDERAEEKWYEKGNTPPPGKPSGYPAAVRNRFGKGESLYFAGDLFSTYWKTDAVDLRHMITRAVELLIPAGERLLELRASPSVEVTLFRNGNRTLVHLVNYHGEKRKIPPPTGATRPPSSRFRRAATWNCS